MTEQNEEHFEVISENRAREFEKKQTYKPLTDIYLSKKVWLMAKVYLPTMI